MAGTIDVINLYDTVKVALDRDPSKTEMSRVGVALYHAGIPTIKKGQYRPSHFRVTDKDLVERIIKKVVGRHDEVPVWTPEDFKKAKLRLPVSPSKEIKEVEEAFEYWAKMARALDKMAKRIEDLETEVNRLRSIKVPSLSPRAVKALAVYGD